MSVLHRLSARPFGRGAVIVSIALVATAALSSAPVGAAGSGTCTSAPLLDLANPSAGDLLSPGDYIVSGVARDPASTSGDGIDRVELFVGNRDLGGTEVGAAVPQQGVFAVTAKLPGNVIGGTSFFAYAHSSVTGQETAVSVPVFLGAAPTPTPRSGTDVVATPVVPVVAQASCAPPTSSSTAGSGAPVLQLGNPNAGDTLLLGDYVVSGLAYVPGLAGGAGVDHVDFFLGSRDAGGTFLGSAVPGQSAGLAVGGFATRITVPNQNRGGTTMFFAYAQNSVTGQEAVVTVPVSVGVAPTPTPRPTN